MFSLVRTGTLSFNTEIDAAVLPTHLAECLWGVRASTVEIEGNRVAFTRRMFRFVGSWNVLVPFESGDLTVDVGNLRINYRVSVRGLVLFGTGAVVAMTTFIILKLSVWQPLLLMPLMWLWLVGANLVIGIARFEDFVTRAIASAPHLAVQSTSSHR